MVKIQKKVAIAQHRPVAILIDKSKSTTYIRAGLNRYANEAMRRMKENTEYRNVTEILAIQFDTEPQVTAEFTRLDQTPSNALTITESKGCTDTGKALLLALELLDRKKEACREDGETYYQPVCFLLTDGNPDPGRDAPEHAVRDYERRYAEAAAQIRQREQENKLTFIAAGLNVPNEKNPNMDKLRELSTHPERIVELDASDGNLKDIEKFFEVVVNATNARPDRTPIDELVDNSLGRGIR